MPPITEQKSLVELLASYAVALASIIGVAVTLWISGRREKRRHAMERLDAYLREQRELCSDALAAIHRFNIAVEVFADSQYWLGPDEAEARTKHEELDKSAALLHTCLLRLRLLIDDEDLGDACDRLLKGYLNARGAAEGVVGAFFEFGELPSSTLHPIKNRKEGAAKAERFKQAEAEAAKRLKKLRNRALEFHEIAHDVLTPEIARPDTRSWKTRLRERWAGIGGDGESSK